MAPRQWRISWNAAFGSFRSSHVATCPDVAPECATVDIPPHEHHVTLDLSHYELAADYGLRENLQLSLRLPYDVKAQHVRYSTLAGAPYTPPYGDIHHRSETLTGVSDASLELAFAPRRDLVMAFGTTLPIGRIEPNPIVLGREGLTHEHIQFGSGTFEPKLSLQYARAGTVGLVARAEAKVSFYENREGFRAPTTFVWSAGPSFRIRSLSIDARLDGQYQTLGRWRGEVDEGSGFENGGLRLQLALPPWRGLAFAPSVYRELWSHGFHDETFHQGTTWSVALTRTF